MGRPKDFKECSKRLILKQAVKHQYFATTIKRELNLNVTMR